jgi:hypothetical protein
VAELRDGKIVRLPGVADAGAATISSDHEGGIWIADSSALVLVREGQFVSYSTRNGLSYGFVTTVVDAQYSNLRPGRYTFQVIAANSDGVWNQEGAAVGGAVGQGASFFFTLPG